MPRHCKCGGEFISRKLSPEEDKVNNIEWMCKTCGKSHRQKLGGPRPRKKKEAKATTTTAISAIEIGKGIIDYINNLKGELSAALELIDELQNCVSERDALQKQINEMQSKYNAVVIGNSVDLPNDYLKGK